MNILIVSSYLPYPLINGGNIRLYNLIKRLSKNHTITLICEKRPFQTELEIEELQKFCKKVITVERRKQWSLSNIMKAGFSMNSFLVTGHTNSLLKRHIYDTLEKEKFDLIHVETFYVMQNIPETEIPIVLAEHNIEYLVYKRFADKAQILLRWLLYIDILKLKRNEINAWRRASKLLAVSTEEKNLMSNTVEVIPNGVDIHAFQFKKPSTKEYRSMARHLSLPEKQLLFIGDFKWMQNRDAAAWIITDIWPYLLRAMEEEIKITMHVVGKNIPDSIKTLNMYDSILFDENAPNETPLIFKQADILLAPIRIAGGSSYKILEAMATGVPVVTTTRGIKGLEVVPGEHIIVGDDTQSIVEKTARVLRDGEYYANIALNARKFIEEHHNWDVIAEKLDQVYKTIKKKGD